MRKLFFYSPRSQKVGFERFACSYLLVHVCCLRFFQMHVSTEQQLYGACGCCCCACCGCCCAASNTSQNTNHHHHHLHEHHHAPPSPPPIVRTLVAVRARVVCQTIPTAANVALALRRNPALPTDRLTAAHTPHPIVKIARLLTVGTLSLIAIDALPVAFGTHSVVTDLAKFRSRSFATPAGSRFALQLLLFFPCRIRQLQGGGRVG